ncbi:hypothetical protein E4U41_003607 [Claviceps citrina]|nr:hypothetical protein E4U41_003607 [Claviceps citrina]
MRRLDRPSTHRWHNSSKTAATSTPTPAPLAPPVRGSRRTSLHISHISHTSHTSQSLYTSSSSPAGSTAAARAPLPPQLHHRQQHASALKPKPRPLSASVSHNMPVGDGRPRQPQLSAAGARAANRVPLTPKIAAKGPPVTPLARRPHSSTPVLASSIAVPRDDPSSSSSSTTITTATIPANAFLTGVTPRSGPRQARVDSAASTTPSGTPSGTPNLDKTNDAWENNTGQNNSHIRTGLATLPAAGDAPRQAVFQTDTAAGSSAESSKFFYASDARMAQPAAAAPMPRPASASQKTGNVFLYANGAAAAEGGGRNMSPPSATGPAPNPNSNPNPNPESASAKFFFANGEPETSSRPTLLSCASGPVVSSTSRLAPSRAAASSYHPGSVASAPPRPASPIKPASTPVTHTLKSNATSPTSPRRTSLLSSLPVLQQQQQQQQQQQPSRPVSKRKVSIDVVPREMGRCQRAGSAAAPVEPLVLSRSTLSPNLSETAQLHSPPLSPGLPKTGMTMASMLQAAEDLRQCDEDDSTRDEDLPSEVHSPTRSTTQSRDPVHELVANARRERKVQDLEITNASLEAINRTLERQLRRQTAELRRYRRLSRSGALSAASSRVTSLALSEPLTDVSDVDDTDETVYGGDGDEGKSDHDNDDDDDDDDDDDEDMDSPYESDQSSCASTSTSTEATFPPGAKIEARRRRDEKRLQLDLTKHQELLIDSQKMNQSLKRCLDFTEALIREGHKALEYRVRVSDIKLGGRILAPPDEDEDDDVEPGPGVGHGHGHVSCLPRQRGEEGGDAATAMLRGGDAALEPLWSKGGQDRDSGIELQPPPPPPPPLI